LPLSINPPVESPRPIKPAAKEPRGDEQDWHAEFRRNWQKNRAEWQRHESKQKRWLVDEQADADPNRR